MEYMQWREQLADLRQPPRVCVTEIPLLYEAGAEERFDKIVVITAPDDVRRDRAGPAVEQREGRFLAEAEKVARADYAYVNDGSLDELDAFVAGVMEELKA